MDNDSEAGPRVIRLAPYKYVHVLDTNSNVSRVLAGPLTYTRQEHEQVLSKFPHNMIVLPAQHYVEILNPVVRSADGKDIVRDQYHQAKLRHGEYEFRIFDQYPEPFPLYPGEEQVGTIKPLTVVPVDQALRVRATRKFDDHAAGDEWLFVGPGTYYPRVEEQVVEVVNAIIIQKNQAIKFRAEKKCKDALGVEHAAGEEWLVRAAGAYLPQIDEVLVDVVHASVLTDRTALHLRASRTFKDVYGIQRKAGEEWLVTTDIAETHVQDVHEEIVGTVEVTTLTNRQYCVVMDPVVNGVQKRGTRELRKGEASFFLQPGEMLENNRIENVLILGEDEAVLVHANESFTEKEGGKEIKREAGERWMVHGPREYIPSIQVQVLEVRKAIPLDVNEGVYVRDKKTGQVRAVKGETYMLQPTETLWSKYLPPEVEQLLDSQRAGSAYVEDPTRGPSTWAAPSSSAPVSLGKAPLASGRTRDPTKLVSFEVPHNAAVQVYDYKTKSSRILFGPTLVMLDPEEQFTVLRLSGGVPKEPSVIKTLCLQLGPDFMRDQIIVETSDHARLRLTIAYNWYFQVNRQDHNEAAKVFNVKDFVGDACKTLASRIRGAVAVESFDHFHKHSAKIIRTSIFGLDETGKMRNSLVFEANNLCITNVDVQSAEPVDALTRESLQK
jgi:major vault protein